LTSSVVPTSKGPYYIELPMSRVSNERVTVWHNFFLKNLVSYFWTITTFIGGTKAWFVVRFNGTLKQRPSQYNSNKWQWKTLFTCYYNVDFYPW